MFFNLYFISSFLLVYIYAICVKCVTYTALHACVYLIPTLLKITLEIAQERGADR